MRVGIIAFLQESNTFLGEQTRLEHFQQDVLLTGEAMRQRFAGAPHEVGGFLAGLAEAGLEAVPLFAARALPYGTIAADAFDQLLAMMLAELERALPLDGLLVAPHGATVSERHPDADGYWLEQVRFRVGRGVPIIGTLDPHGNLSPRMVGACDALTAYRTNPHLDQRDRGLEAADLMARTLAGKIRPTQAAAFPPLAINIECQLTSEPPSLELCRQAREVGRHPGVLSTSVMLGFPYADVEEMGSSLLVVTDNDRDLAHRLADELGSWLWQHREEFAGRLLDVAAALDRAAGLEGPVCLLDMGDNVGGGSPGDSTWLGHALLQRRLGPSLLCLNDPRVVKWAEAGGVGARLDLAVGGKSGPLHGTPLEGDWTVVSLHDGRFEESEARHGGFTHFDQGRTVVLNGEPGGLTLLVTSRRMVPFSLRQLTSCGLDPAAFRFLVAKGVIAPVAAYQAVCKSFVRVDTPGVTSADLTRLPYRNRRQPLFPLEKGDRHISPLPHRRGHP
jgi:microcystin degradation protein MlrC